jgi:LysR family transcriptional regulator, benzoate and cis,cis-muconate-responsive activator of ben and cat genes
MLDTMQLQMFVAVAHTLHFGRAADQLGVTQPIVSRRIQELERRVRARLFNRGRRSAISLTAAGLTLLSEATTVLKQLERTEQAVLRTARGEAGRIEIGYVASAALAGVLPSALAKFRRERPAVEVNVTLMETPRQLAALRDGLLDVGFVRPRPTYPEGISATRIHREPMLVAMAASHPLARRRIQAAALAKERFIVPQFDESVGFAEYVALIGARGNFLPQTGQPVRDFISAIALASAGYGIVPVPRCMTRLSIEGVVYKPIRDFEDVAELAIAHRSHKLSPATRAFVSLAGSPSLSVQ